MSIFHTTTDSLGEFRFEELNSGNYTVDVSKMGYYPATRKIELSAGDTRHEVFYLTAQQTNDPTVYDFKSPRGEHFIEGMPGDISIKLQLFQKIGGELSGEYKNGETGECFLGATSLSGSVSGGPEATALVDFKFPKARAGVYIGGTGTWDFGICPEFAIEGFTGRMYAGAFAQSYGLEYKIESGAEIQWDFTGTKTTQVLALTDLRKTAQGTTWQPIGSKPLQWGDANRLAMEGSERRMILTFLNRPAVLMKKELLRT